jgi:type I restriction enzyme S subunit
VSEQSKASAFPDTVQPGIPQLPDRPPIGWKRTPLSFDLYEAKRPVEMKDEDEYDLVTVKRGRGGVVKRERKLGADISVKTQFEVKAGDFLISKRQIVHGACGIVPPALEGSTVSNEYAVLRSRGAIDLEFLKYLSHSTYFQQTCFHSSIGVHIEKMIFKTDKWFAWEFDLPPLAEQGRIAEILSSWDRAIEATEKLIANSQAQKKALMQQLLTCKKRLPGFSGQWRTTHLESVVEVDPESLSSATPPGQRFKYISLSEVEPGRIADNLPELDFASAPSRARKCVKRGDVLMSTVRPNLCGFAKVCSNDTNLVASTGFAVLRARSKISIDFVLHSLFGEFFSKQIDALVAGSNYPAISSSDVKHLLVQIPEFGEQTAISKVLGDAEAVIQLLIDNKARLAAEKASLMQQLLTGKRRVKLPSAQEEAA